MGSADARDTKDGDKDCEGPSGGYDNPSRILALASVEEDGCDDAVAQDDKQRRPDEFGEWGIHRSST
jgi:hypothetical protein